MSKSISLDRVMAALKAGKISTMAIEMPSETRTAVQAADAMGCDLDQIAKSIIFAGADTGDLFLFITAGGNQVDVTKAAALARETLGRADPHVVRKKTGFAIGGVAPVGHLGSIQAFYDPRLDDFSVVFAAAGTPRHVFGIEPADLLRVSGAQIANFVQA